MGLPHWGSHPYKKLPFQPISIIIMVHDFLTGWVGFLYVKFGSQWVSNWNRLIWSWNCNLFMELKLIKSNWGELELTGCRSHCLLYNRVWLSYEEVGKSTCCDDILIIDALVFELVNKLMYKIVECWWSLVCLRWINKAKFILFCKGHH